jgi:ATP-dependent RNA circularization protein (DNA/RNA ligase family)
MKTFKEYAGVPNINEKEESFQKFSAEAIKNINSLIEFGRKTAELDNAQLNPLLDAIKNIHKGEDVIRKSLSADEEDLKQDKPEKKEW